MNTKIKSVYGLCDNCGKIIKIVIHHKDFNHLNDVAENRQPLCYRCHLLAHGRAERGTGARSERLSKDWKPEQTPWNEVRRQYFACFPRA